MFLLSVFVKSTSQILKLFKRGSGTAWPGLMVERINPKIIKKLLKDIPHKVVITGTNGKTTTQIMARSILNTAKRQVLTNSAGANLKRGIISALLKNTNFWGRLKYDYVILEVEEATLPQIIEDIEPEIIVVTNLFRDQLDAYGEVDITEKHIRKSLELAPNAKFVLNLDDPRVSKLSDGLKNDAFYTSLPTEFAQELPYEGEDYSPIESPDTLKAAGIKIEQNLSVGFHVKNNQAEIKDINIKSPGFFHVYNALSAIQIGLLLNINPDQIKDGLIAFNPAFGRGEEIISLNKDFKLKLLLVKNPAGMNLNFDLLKHTKDFKLVLLLNDNTADGKDISWIWDAKFEKLNNLEISKIYLGGSRAKDLGVRIKYALHTEKLETLPVDIEEDISQLLEKLTLETKKDETIFVLPTYTAMLQLRKLLGYSLE